MDFYYFAKYAKKKKITSKAFIKVVYDSAGTSTSLLLTAQSNLLTIQSWTLHACLYSLYWLHWNAEYYECNKVLPQFNYIFKVFDLKFVKWFENWTVALESTWQICIQTILKLITSSWYNSMSRFRFDLSMWSIFNNNIVTVNIYSSIFELIECDMHENFDHSVRYVYNVSRTTYYTCTMKDIAPSNEENWRELKQ